ncbi:MAG TPA: hypothetical protein PKE23_13235, partial [Anaerolineales bacterium]|nr:hypothetical protein [Anaerolineales bacterium]
AKVTVQSVDDADFQNLQHLLTAYADELRQNHQAEEAENALGLLIDWKNTFVRVVSEGLQEDQRFATE